MFAGTESLTPQITGGKKQSEVRAALFAVRVHLLVKSCIKNKSFIYMIVEPDSSQFLANPADWRPAPQKIFIKGVWLYEISRGGHNIS